MSKRQARIHKGKRNWYGSYPHKGKLAFLQRACFLDIRPWSQVEIGDIPRQVQMRIEKWREGVGFR